MKTFIFIILLMNTCLCRYIDSCGVFPFGSDLDLRNDVTISDLIRKFGPPDSGMEVASNLYLYFPNMICYTLNGKVYNMEIIKGKFQELEIGMTKKQIRENYGPCVIIKTFPDNLEIQEFGYYDQNWIRYVVTLFITNDSLTKISVYREDNWF